MKEPADLARRAEDHLRLPSGTCERVAGYGVMGLSFASGHVLGLRRWTVSSVGPGFTSIWHRNPAGQWTFYETAPCDVACTRYFGAGVERNELGPIHLEWQGPRQLHIRCNDSSVDWTIQLGSTLVTRMMSTAGAALPLGAWRSPPILKAMGHLAGSALGVGNVKLAEQAHMADFYFPQRGIFAMGRVFVTPA